MAYSPDKQIAYATESDPARLEPVLEQRLENALETFHLALSRRPQPIDPQLLNERLVNARWRPDPSAASARAPRPDCTTQTRRPHCSVNGAAGSAPTTTKESAMRTIALRRGLAALLVAALSYGVQADEKSANTLRIGYQKYGTLVLLKARGTLEKRLAEDGVKVQWTEFPGGPQLLEGLNVGSIDFGVTGETPPVFAQAAGADLLYVAYEPPAPTSEAILLPKDSPIRSVAELKGRKVALNKGSNVHYLLVRALEQAGLKYSDIQPVYLPPADARAAFERHSVDAWVIWDPYQAAAEKQLSARVLVDGRELVDNHQFYLATRTYAQRHPQVLDKLVDEIRQVGDWSRANPQQVTEQVAPLLGLPADITLTAVKRQGYGAQLITPAVVEAQQKIADTFTQLKLIPKPLSIKDVIWTPPAGKVASAP